MLEHYILLSITLTVFTIFWYNSSSSFDLRCSHVLATKFYKKWAKKLTTVKGSALFTFPNPDNAIDCNHMSGLNGYRATILNRPQVKVLLEAAAGGLRYRSSDGDSI